MELHCHSGFSFGDGASPPEALARRAAELGYTALALTDHDDLGGAVRFTRACEAEGIHPLPGAELTLDDDSHLTLLVESETGWRNLATLITAARTGNPRGEPRLSLDRLAERAEGLIALSGCPRGGIPMLLREERYAEAREQAGRLHDAFGDRFYLELWDHRTFAEASLCADLLDLAKALEIPWTVTNNVHYADLAGRGVHDLLVANRSGVTLAEAEQRGLLRPSAEWCLQSPRVMAERWNRLPDGIRRTLEIAERCAGFRLLDIRPAPPHFPLPAGWADADAYLAHLAGEGLRSRLDRPSSHHERQLEHELATVREIGIADHFLIVWDICRFAREQGIFCQGRGSAANSLICYALRVTAVDPVANDLLFERFVSAERPEPPDIDIDFAADEARERVIQYVYAKYGRAHAAMVCTHVEYRGRSAIRGAMRGLGFPAATAGWLAKRLDGHASARIAAEWLETEDGKTLRAIGLEPAEARARALVRLVRGLDGLPRHRGIHSGGFVLSRGELGSMVPIEPAAMAGRTVIQWDKDDCADVGLPKFDLLGLGMLRLLGECVEHVRNSTGEDLDLGRLPLDDPAVYARIGAADTVGLFQIESRAQANFLPRLCPRTFYDLVISVGAIRPGPMLGGQVKEMLARRRGEAETEYPHPDLEPVLSRTHGMALFQEQLMRCAIVVSGCSPGQADTLRRAMSRKRSAEEMRRATEAIRAGMRAQGMDPDSAERVLGWLEACASYTFPESHAISFALLAYASAWLRHYHPAEYLCSILNAQPMGFYPVATLIHDAKEHGVEVRPVDLARSGWDCSLEVRKYESTRVRECESELSTLPRFGGIAVRVGLRYVRGLGARAGARLRAALEAGPFTSVADVIGRSGMEERELRALAAAGAFRSLIPGGRRQALWTVLGELRRMRSGGPLAPPASAPVSLPALSDAGETVVDHHATGFTLQGHPMRHLRDRLTGLGVQPIEALRAAGRRNGERVRTAGLVIVRQRPGTAKGFVFVGLEDETGRLDVIVSPTLYAEERETINGSGILAVLGRLGVEDGVVNLRAERFYPLQLEDARAVVSSHDYH
ncbi:MAG: error-prone DNA polymerase [Gemmatimonadetes bacterium]|nr:error-prone DNA polymerase [Gemmatimonadota bacterium]